MIVVTMSKNLFLSENSILQSVRSSRFVFKHDVDDGGSISLYLKNVF